MRIAEHVEVLRHDGEQMAGAARRAGLDAAVPTCPGWRVRDVLQHLGGVHRWATAYVATARSQPFTAAERNRFFASVADDTLIDWFVTGHRALLDTLVGAAATTSCWTFLPAPSPLAFWARRQAHETAIHRADTESALSTVPHWDARFAVDGIDELLAGLLVSHPERIAAHPPASIALSATDADAGWTIHIEPAGYRAVDGTHPATLTLAGSASDVYLLLWNRADVDRFEVRGDVGVLDTWRAKATIT
jgi:uncharacterized protein (TIGR03083 family)